VLSEEKKASQSQPALKGDELEEQASALNQEQTDIENRYEEVINQRESSSGSHVN